MLTFLLREILARGGWQQLTALHTCLMVPLFFCICVLSVALGLSLHLRLLVERDGFPFL